MKSFVLRLDKETHSLLKTYCFFKEISMNDYITKLVKKDLNKHKDEFQTILKNLNKEDENL